MKRQRLNFVVAGAVTLGCMLVGILLVGAWGMIPRALSVGCLVVVGIAGGFGLMGLRRTEAACRLERRRTGLCIRCGYNLHGNISGVCPECGTWTGKRDAMHEPLNREAV
jgi:hypothetical protein